MQPAEYDAMYRAEDRHWWYRALRARIGDAAVRHGAGGPLQILDAGCGTGANAAALAPLGEVVAMDYAHCPLAYCRRRGLPRLVSASVEALPYRAECFDLVVSCDVLCHAGVRQPGAALEEMARTLKPGGTLLLNLPAYPWLLSAHDHAVANDRRFTRAEAIGLVEGANLVLVRCTYWNTLLFPLALVQRLWGRVHPTRHSDIARVPGAWVNKTLAAILGVERSMLRCTNLPFGLSILIVARKR